MVVMTSSVSTVRNLFLMNVELLRHMTVHKDERIYQCSKCDVSYLTNSDLISHMAMHIDKESFMCTVCEKSFLSNDEFSNHMVIHTGNFMVNITDNREIPFSKQNDLRNHISPPTSEKPNKCERCEKSFSEESTLLSPQVNSSTDQPKIGTLKSQILTAFSI